MSRQIFEDEERRLREKRSRSGSFFHKILQLLVQTIIIVAVIALIIYVLRDYAGLKLSSFLDGTSRVTNVMVERQLEAIEELVTYEYVYTDITQETNTRQLFDLDIPGTTNSVYVIYSGTIKVGYNASKIGIEVDPGEKKIYVTLPEAEVTDNYIEEDKLKYVESNNIFNPIKSENITNLLSEQKEIELENAKENGIFEKAEQNAQRIIRAWLSTFDDYEVVFRGGAKNDVDIAEEIQ